MLYLVFQSVSPNISPLSMHQSFWKHTLRKKQQWTLDGSCGSSETGILSIPLPMGMCWLPSNSSRVPTLSIHHTVIQPSQKGSEEAFKTSLKLRSDHQRHILLSKHLEDIWTVAQKNPNNFDFALWSFRIWGWGWSSVVEWLTSMFKALGPIPYIAKKKKPKQSHIYIYILQITYTR